MKTVAIIDYGSGNLRSAAKSFEKAALNTGHKVLVTANPRDLAAASHIVLPGVGAFADCMNGLRALPGMIEMLKEEIFGKRKPFLGICVGMQLLAEQGFEHGEHAGLGWIAGRVVPIKPTDPGLKIPHMGWNTLRLNRADHPLFRGIEDGAHAYFVHSFHFECAPEARLAEVDYGSSITAAIAQDNIMGTQFHPEKSQRVGLKLIENFLAIHGA